jgi:hypothetical protein
MVSTGIDHRGARGITVSDGQQEQVPEEEPLALWSDDPADVDFLAFDAVASTVADILLDPALDPVALGLSGSWGSGKTTVLQLTEAELESRSAQTQDEGSVVAIQTQPWRYDPTTGAKESVIGEVLTALTRELDASPVEKSLKDQALASAKRLRDRVDWAKAVKMAAKTSLALQLPSVDEIADLVKPKADDEGELTPRGLEDFRREFSALIENPALAHVSAVVVLVDDLDRCLPETVVETLEAIRLFLSVPRMSFVIAADEDRVADAIARHLTKTGAPVPADDEGEDPSHPYLHKIVQTTIPLPALSRFDTQAFLLLLQLQQTLQREQIDGIINQCTAIRQAGGGLDKIEAPDDVDLSEQVAFAARLTPILYEKLGGNPRRIKRFLNDLRVRQAVAGRRGIALDAAIVAKLMVLERLLDDDFKSLLGWLAQGSLRDQLAALEVAAGRPNAEATATGAAKEPEDAVKVNDDKAAEGGDKSHRSTEQAGPGRKGDFSEGLLRWAKLPPSLAGVDISPYLFLAAAFSGTTLLDEGLSERLRDIAANLLSRRDARAVTDEDLVALPTNEADELLMHLGRTIRDQRSKQGEGITAILRIVQTHPDRAAIAAKALEQLPPEDLRPGTALLFSGTQPDEIAKVIKRWEGSVERSDVRESLRQAREKGQD